MATADLHICLISVHGLIRSESLELGRDADTGGQVMYVVELARALAHVDGWRVSIWSPDPSFRQKLILFTLKLLNPWLKMHPLFA